MSVNDAGRTGPELPEAPPSGWQVLRSMLPDVIRLVRDLTTDPRVPLRTKLAAAAALGYAVFPARKLPASVPGSRVGLDDVAAVLVAVRILVAGAGYELVRERWTGTDAAFGMLVVLAGVHR